MHTEGQEGVSARVSNSPEGTRDYGGGTIGHHQIRWSKIRLQCPVLAGVPLKYDRTTPRFPRARDAIPCRVEMAMSLPQAAGTDGERNDEGHTDDRKGGRVRFSDGTAPKGMGSDRLACAAQPAALRRDASGPGPRAALGHLVEQSGVPV